MRSRLLLPALVLLLPSRIAGQASVNVATSDRVYREIDKLVAHGLVDAHIFGQRPYSRREIARIVAEAEGNMSRLVQSADAHLERAGAVRDILDRLQVLYHDELVQLGAVSGATPKVLLRPLNRAEGRIITANTPARAIPPAARPGSLIDAVVNPLIQNRRGRRIVDGTTVWAETDHTLRIAPHVAVYAQPRLQLGLARNGQPDVNHAVIQNLYAKVVFANLALEVGRDHLLWGQGSNVGSLISHNPRGFDMVKIGNESPFRLPWIFRLAGPAKFTIFLADLGPNQNFPGANLVGYKVSIQPFRTFEFGSGILNQSGGEGAPSATLLERVFDALPFLENFVGAATVSSKLATLDFRLSLPAIRGTQLYGELTIDDWDLDRLESMLTTEAGHLLGLHAPRITDNGDLSLTVEYHHTGIRQGRHPQFTSGMTLDHLVIGDQLGPDGKGLYLETIWDIDPRNLVSVEGAFERRSRDLYRLDYPTWITEESFPKEHRFRAVATWFRQVPGAGPLRLQTAVGYERATNFSFVAGANRNNWLAQVGVELDFGAAR